MKSKVILYLFLAVGLVSCAVLSGVPHKKLLKSLRGEWKLDGMIQYGDTVFSMSTMDSNQFVVDFIQQNKEMRELKTLSEKDSLLMADIIRKRLTNLTSTRIIFEKDSVYKSLAQDEKHNSYGKYWAKDDHSVYIKDLRRGTTQFWEVELSENQLRMEHVEERMVFLLKKR